MTPGACGVHAHEHNLVPCSLENLDVGDCLEVLDIESIDREYRCSSAFTWYTKDSWCFGRQSQPISCDFEWYLPGWETQCLEDV